jgi:hypothetical protein
MKQNLSEKDLTFLNSIPEVNFIHFYCGISKGQAAAL